MQKIRIFLLTSVLALGLSACGYDGHFRYPCQDPTNWELAECKPPICTANGAGPADLAPQEEKVTQNG